MKDLHTLFAFLIIGMAIGLGIGRYSVYLSPKTDSHELAKEIIFEHRKLGLLIDTSSSNQAICAQGTRLAELMSGDVEIESSHELADEFLQFYLSIFSEYIHWNCPTTAQRLSALDDIRPHEPNQ